MKNVNPKLSNYNTVLTWLQTAESNCYLRQPSKSVKNRTSQAHGKCKLVTNNLNPVIKEAILKYKQLLKCVLIMLLLLFTAINTFLLPR